MYMTHLVVKSQFMVILSYSIPYSVRERRSLHNVRIFQDRAASWHMKVILTILFDLGLVTSHKLQAVFSASALQQYSHAASEQ
jgi:hypothetical protein